MRLNQPVDIAGIPVDVEIKYQTYWRNGCLQDGVTLKDNI